MANVTLFTNHSDTPQSIINASHTSYDITGATLGQGTVTSLRVYMFGLLGAFMTVGNSLTVYAVATTDNLRVKSYVMMTSLAVNDVIFGLTVIHFSVHESLARQPCSLATYRSVMRPIERMVPRTSFFHITAIAVDRYVAVEYPLHYEMYMTSTNIGLIIASLWLLSTLLTAPAYLSFTSLSRHFWSPTCIVTLWPYFEAVTDLVLYVCNSAVVVFLYAKLWSVAMRHEKMGQPQITCSTASKGSREASGHNPVPLGQVQQLDANDTTAAHANTTTSQYPEAQNDVTRPQSTAVVYTDTSCNETDVNTFRVVGALRKFFSRSWSSQHRATRTALALTASFIVLWFPYLVSRLMQIFGQSSVAAASLEVVGTVCGSTNIALNVVLYAVVNRDFRASFKRLLCVKFKFKFKHTIHPSTL